MRLFRRRSYKKQADQIEETFQQAVNLVKDLDKKEFNRMMDGIKLAWEGYNKIRQVQTIDEKEMADISESEKELDYLETMKD